MDFLLLRPSAVALHPEGVDRNLIASPEYLEVLVALHPEGVDRNLEMIGFDQADIRVALHPEGVDRNLSVVSCANRYHVALHPEGVDRNAKAQ